MQWQFANLGAAVPLDENPETETVTVWDTSRDALTAFLSLQTQWRKLVVAGSTVARVFWEGLDYQAVDVVLRQLDLKRVARRQVFFDLQAMEGAALDAFADVVD